MIPWLLSFWAKASPVTGFLGKHWRVLAIVAALGLAWMHYTGLRNENEKLRHNLDKTTTALARLETQVHDFEAALERNALDARAARKERDRVFDLLERSDLGALAREDPDSLERSVNERADGVLHDLRCATGGACTDPGEAGASEP